MHVTVPRGASAVVRIAGTADKKLEAGSTVVRFPELDHTLRATVELVESAARR